MGRAIGALAIPAGCRGPACRPAIKTRYDPENLFRMNQNIRPEPSPQG